MPGERLRRPSQLENRGDEARRQLSGFLNASRAFYAQRSLATLQQSRRALELRQSERSRNFLLRLADALRSLKEPMRIVATACDMLRRQFGDVHVIYWEMLDAERAVAAAESAAPGEPTVLGRLHRFGDLLTSRLGNSHGARAVWRDAVSLPEGSAAGCDTFFDPTRTAAWALAPLVKRLRVRAVLSVMRPEPHHWGAEEVRLIEETVERTWTAVERALAEAALRESETRYRLTVEGASDYAFITMTDDGNVASWSAGACAIFGWSVSEAMGRSIDFLSTPEDRAARVKRCDLADVRTRGATTVGGWRVRKDGSRVYVDGSLGTLPGASASGARFIEIVKDVTQARRAERALFENEERYRMLLENVGDYAIVLLDASGVVREWTSGAETMFGYPPREIIGKSASGLLPPEAVLDFAGALERASVDGRATFEAIRVRRGGKRFWAEEVLTAVYDADMKHVAFSSITRDLTERRRAARIAERQRRAFERDALRRRLAVAEEDERRRLSRELHDEAGQHLTALSLGIQAIAAAVEPGSDAERRAAALGELANTLSRELHELALRLRPRALDDFGLDAALEAYADAWSQRSQLEIDLRSQLTGKRLAPGIESALYRIVQEALTNVNRHASAHHVEIVLEQRGEHIWLTIDDDGCGFDASPANGWPHAKGLGLLGMQERVELLGGSFEIESSVGAGTTLFVRVPLTETETAVDG